MPRQLRCVLLCEDLAQERLLRPILGRMFHQVRVKRGGGFTYVFRQTPLEVGYVRRYPKEAVGLVIAVDGDEAGWRGRVNAINRQLTAGGAPALDASERVALCVPTRNVETWCLWLLGHHDVEEVSDYKERFNRLCAQEMAVTKRAVAAWFNPPDEDAEKSRLPSLIAGRSELDRLKRLART